MENQYGITITNKYDLFLSDQDPLEILQLQEQLKAARKSEKTKSKTSGAAAAAGATVTGTPVGTGAEKDSKSAKNKQIKAAVVVATQEAKAAEKVETTTPSPPKKDDKPKRTKSSKIEDGVPSDAKPKERQSGKTGSIPKSKEETFPSPMEFGNQTEFGHFEVRPSDRNGNRERRTRDGFGDRLERGGSNRDRREGSGGNIRPDGRERSDRGGFGRERRPRGRYMSGRPPRRGGGYSDDRQRSGASGEDQERGFFTEGDHSGSAFGEGRGITDHPGDKGGFSDQYERKSSEEYGRRGAGSGGFDSYGGFDNDQHFEDRQDRGNFERRTFESRRNNYGERRNYEDRQDRGGGFVERKRRGGFGEQESQSFGHWSEKSGDGEDREFRRGRGGFGRRGRARGRPGFGRRDFDRHGGGNDQTGSGLKGTEKREGGGSHNWGTTMDDLEGQTENQTVIDGATWGEQAEAAENQEISGTSGAKLSEEKGDGSAGIEEATEEEPKVMTLDEWKALQSTTRVKPEYNIRKPGEGCNNDPQWKKMFALTRKNVKEPSDEEDEEELEEDKHAKSKNVLPIEITFTDNPRRGGRGGRRGVGGRGGGSSRGYPLDGSGFRGDLRKSPSSRGDREGGGGGRRGARERAPNVADEHDFPSLDKAVPVQ